MIHCSSCQDIPKYDFLEARKLANRFEILDEPAFNPFLNRSALKLANLDCILKVCARAASTIWSIFSMMDFLKGSVYTLFSGPVIESWAPFSSLLLLVQGQFVSKSGAEGSQGRLTFVDLCGGPGGFSEYLLRRCEAMDKPATG
jgi:hypothetical protein